MVVERIWAGTLDVRAVRDDRSLDYLRSDDVFYDARDDGRPSEQSRDPLDILKERFARGEITQAQYEEQRRLIEA